MQAFDVFMLKKLCKACLICREKYFIDINDKSSYLMGVSLRKAEVSAWNRKGAWNLIWGAELKNKHIMKLPSIYPPNKMYEQCWENW